MHLTNNETKIYFNCIAFHKDAVNLFTAIIV